MVLSINKLNLELRVLLEAVGLASESSVLSFHKDEWLQKVTQCDFDLLLRLANHHGLVPWLAFNLKSPLAANNRPADSSLTQLHKLNQMLRFKSGYQTKTAAVISAQFNEKKLPHIVFKGSALFHQVYPEFLLSRASDDLDILVAPEDLGDAVSILEDSGYQIHGCDASAPQVFTDFIAEHSKWYRFRDISLIRSDNMVHQIDLHWRIADEFSFCAETESLIAGRTVVNTQYGELSALPLHKHFVYCCSHGYSDYFFRLRSLADVYLAMKHKNFNKQATYDFARECGVLKQVKHSIDLAHYFFCGDDEHKINKHTKLVMQRLIDSNGLTSRVHPNKGSWTRADKNNYLIKQILNRSAKSYWFSPILARTKLISTDLKGWSNNRNSVLWFYLNRTVQKLFIKNK